MNEETQTADQPLESVTQEPAAREWGSFLGTEPSDVDTAAEESPETSAEEEATEESPAESEEEAEVEAAPVEEAVAEEAEEEAEQPPVTERLKDLTPRDLEQYQARYPTAWKMLNDPNQPEDIKHLLLDKIESDHWIAQSRAEAETEEEPTPEVEPAAAVAQPDAIKARETYYQNLSTLVERAFDQQAVKEIGETLLSMFNVDTKRLNDPNLPPEDKAELQGLVNSVQKGAPMLARGMADAVNTVLPHVILPALEMAMPGITQIYERQMYGMQWDTVRNQVGQDGKAVYASLPAYGSKEFSSVMREAAAQIPGFDEMVFRGKDGQVLPPAQQALAKYTVLAKMATGQKVSPAIVAQAVATGKKLAGQADRKRQAGKALGAGQPTHKAFGGSSKAEEDPMLAALDAEISRYQGDLLPVSGNRR